MILLPGVKYWATVATKQKEISINKAVRSWTSEDMDRTPTRTAAIWMMDTNVKQGVKKGGYGPEEAQSGMPRGGKSQWRSTARVDETTTDDGDEYAYEARRSRWMYSSTMV